MSIFPYFKGESYDSDHPLENAFLNNASFIVHFIKNTLLERLETNAVPLLDKVGVVELPYLVLPLTVEPTKPHL